MFCFLISWFPWTAAPFCYTYMCKTWATIMSPPPRYFSPHMEQFLLVVRLNSCEVFPIHRTSLSALPLLHPETPPGTGQQCFCPPVLDPSLFLMQRHQKQPGITFSSKVWLFTSLKLLSLSTISSLCSLSLKGDKCFLLSCYLRVPFLPFQLCR